MKWKKITKKTKFPSHFLFWKDGLYVVYFLINTKNYKLVRWEQTSEFFYQKVFIEYLKTDEELQEQNPFTPSFYLEIVPPKLSPFKYDFNHGDSCESDCKCRKTPKGFAPAIDLSSTNSLNVYKYIEENI